MEIFGYLWLSILLAYLLAVILPLRYDIKREFIYMLCLLAGVALYWAAFRYDVHFTVIVFVSSVLIYLCIDIRGVTETSKKIFGYIRDSEMDKARRELSIFSVSSAGIALYTEDMDEDTVITDTVEYTASALVPSAVAPLFYTVLLGPLGAVLYRYLRLLAGTSSSGFRRVMDYIPSYLAFAAFWITTSTVTKNRTYMMSIIKRDMPQSNDHVSDLIVAGFAGTTWMRLGGEKKITLSNSPTPISLNFPAFGDMREPPHISDILRADKLFHLTVIIFLVFSLSVREYDFIWQFLRKFVI